MATMTLQHHAPGFRHLSAAALPQQLPRLDILPQLRSMLFVEVKNIGVPSDHRAYPLLCKRPSGLRVLDRPANSAATAHGDVARAIGYGVAALPLLTASGSSAPPSYSHLRATSSGTWVGLGVRLG